MTARTPRKRKDPIGDACGHALSLTGSTVDVMRLRAYRTAVEAATVRGEGLEEAAIRLACAYDVKAHVCDFVPARSCVYGAAPDTRAAQHGHVWIETGQGLAFACSSQGLRALDTYASTWALA